MTVDVHGALHLALSQRFHPAVAELRSSSQRRWSSVTFVGSRHRYALSIRGEDAEAAVNRAAETLAGEDFRIAGHLVADIAITQRQSGSAGGVDLELEALTVEAN